MHGTLTAQVCCANEVGNMKELSGVSPIPLPSALPGERVELDTPAGRVSFYRSMAGGAGPGRQLPPLILIHSVNAAGSAAEMRPVFERCRANRPVYAIDLPGFGFSERSVRRYTPRLMTDAVHALVAIARGDHQGVAVDAMALSLGCEFLARDAQEAPDAYRSIALVSPTGFRGVKARLGPPGSVVGSERVHSVLAWAGWRRGLYGLLTRRGVIRYFLERTWGSKQIDELLLDYDFATARQPGAEHAPLCFLSALLFSDDAMRLYESLRMPVWLIHGIRGDFVDYRQKQRFALSPNWTMDVLPTGALPYFEEAAAFFSRYDAFLKHSGLTPETEPVRTARAG